jgi:OFA family oxalate/formate antiporter-like MFS transporter
MSPVEVRPASGRGIYYGWFVAAACFALTFTLGEGMYTYSIFFNPLSEEFGWSRAIVSSAYTPFLIGYSVSVFVSGRLADRYSPRLVLVISSVLAGLGLALCSTISSIDQFRVFYFMAGLGGGATWSVPIAAVQRWFAGRPNAGLALATVTTGIGAGALVFSPLINYVITDFGWRFAYLSLGVLFFAVIIVSAFVIRQPARVVKPAGEDRGRQLNTEGLGTRKTVKTVGYLLICFVNMSGIVIFQGVLVHLVPHAIDIGISAAAAAAAIGLLGGVSIPGRLISGYLADRLGWRRILAICLFVNTAAVAWLLVASSLWMLYLFVVVLGLSWGGRSPALMGILGEFFGLRSIGELIGITIAIGQLGASFSPYVIGLVFDATGSYSAVFAVAAAILLADGIIVSLMRAPRQLT